MNLVRCKLAIAERSYRLLLEVNLRRAGYRVLLAENAPHWLAVELVPCLFPPEQPDPELGFAAMLNLRPPRVREERPLAELRGVADVIGLAAYANEAGWHNNAIVKWHDRLSEAWTEAADGRARAAEKPG